MNEFPILEDYVSYTVIASLLNGHGEGRKIVTKPLRSGSGVGSYGSFVNDYPDCVSAFENFAAQEDITYQLHEDYLAELMARDKFYLLSQSESKDIFSNGANVGWGKFKKRFGNTGIHTFSRVGFSNDMRYAVCRSSAQFGPLAGSGHLMLLGVREDQTWNVLKSIMLWIS